MLLPFKWKLSACTYTWCCLFFKILQNEIWKSGRNLPLATFGSERVKATEYLLTLGFFNLFLCKVDLIYFEHADQSIT